MPISPRVLRPPPTVRTCPKRLSSQAAWRFRLIPGRLSAIIAFIIIGLLGARHETRDRCHAGLWRDGEAGWTGLSIAHMTLRLRGSIGSGCRLRALACWLALALVVVPLAGCSMFNKDDEYVPDDP